MKADFSYSGLISGQVITEANFYVLAKFPSMYAESTPSSYSVIGFMTLTLKFYSSLNIALVLIEVVFDETTLLKFYVCIFLSSF